MPFWSRRRNKELRRRTDEEWVRDVREQDSGAIAELRLVLIAALMPVLRSRVPRQAEALAEDFAQDALLLIADRLNSYRGDARFTTWCCKIAVRVALSELRRARWSDVSLDAAVANAFDVELQPTAHKEAVSRETAEILHQIIQTQLTERQRKALMAVMFGGMPVEVVAGRLGITRNALYKLLHDARLKIKRILLADGFDLEGV